MKDHEYLGNLAKEYAALGGNEGLIGGRAGTPSALRLTCLLVGVTASVCCSGANTGSPPTPAEPAPAEHCTSTDEPSPASTLAAVLAITNPCSDTLTLRWMDLHGARVAYTRIEPGDHLEQPTWLGHRWELTDLGGRCVDRAVASAARTEWRVDRGGCPPDVLPPLLPGLALSSFYRQYIDAMGIPVVGSARVSARALREAAYLVRRMLALHPEYVLRLAAAHIRVAIMARTEVTTDIPEHGDLNLAFPPTNWNDRARGLAATAARPASSGAEENLLCETPDRYHGESIFIHEFAHTIYLFAIANHDPSFVEALRSAFAASRAAHRWDNTYAATNIEEYWAEGVQDWFNANLEADPPNGTHNSVNTRDELRAYDSALYALVAQVFPADWTWLCPTP